MRLLSRAKSLCASAILTTPLFLCSNLFSQVDTGSILGTVRDVSGGVVPRAVISLTSESTGLTLNTTTNVDGNYQFPGLRIGDYTVSAEATGFGKVTHEHLSLSIQQRLVADFTLNPGTVAETVEVTAAAAQLQTQEASVGAVVQQKLINDLPLNGRNYTFLAQLNAGVTMGQQDTRGFRDSGTFSANGLYSDQNNYLLDGIDNNSSLSDFLNGTVANPFQPLFNGPNAMFNEPDSIYNDPEISQLNLLRPYPQFDGSFSGLPLLGANAWYHAVQIRFSKRASHYISFEGNYTFSKATDDSSSGANAWVGGLGVDNPQVLDDLRAEHSIGANDTPHRLTTAIILDVPVGRNRWIGRGMSPLFDGIVGGWSLESFLTFQSGQPLAIQMSSPRLADGNQRPNVICNNLRTGISYTDAAKTGDAYLNTDCFDDPGDNIAGNARRFFSNLRGPGIRNLDLSLSKEFNVHEDMKLQIRAEMFNATNTPRFATPATGWGSEDFGTVTSSRGNSRKMQFGARFQF